MEPITRADKLLREPLHFEFNNGSKIYFVGVDTATGYGYTTIARPVKRGPKWVLEVTDIIKNDR